MGGSTALITSKVPCFRFADISFSSRVIVIWVQNVSMVLVYCNVRFCLNWRKLSRKRHWNKESTIRVSWQRVATLKKSHWNCRSNAMKLIVFSISMELCISNVCLNIKQSTMSTVKALCNGYTKKIAKRDRSCSDITHGSFTTTIRQLILLYHFASLVPIIRWLFHHASLLLRPGSLRSFLILEIEIIAERMSFWHHQC